MKLPTRIGLQFFAEAPVAEPAAEGTTATTASETPQAEQTPAPVDYAALAQSDEALRAYVAAETRKAVADYQRQAQQQQVEQRTEAEALATMTAEQQRDYFRNKLAQMEEERTRERNAAQLKETTTGIFREKGIPLEMLAAVDFAKATADEVNGLVKLFEGFEMYPKGTFETKVQEALDGKLRQKPPVTGGVSVNGTDDDKILRAMLGE